VSLITYLKSLSSPTLFGHKNTVLDLILTYVPVYFFHPHQLITTLTFYCGHLSLISLEQRGKRELSLELIKPVSQEALVSVLVAGEPCGK
jgi:hypothetical protein